MNNYFCGWYFKCETKGTTLAVIPAYFKKNGRLSCSIQLITEHGVWNIPFKYSEFHEVHGQLRIKIGSNLFSAKGIKLDLHQNGLDVTGCVRFGRLSPIQYDIMGPFRYVPRMECRHSVFSMKHTVNGLLLINGETYRFSDGTGYMEGDRGYSFPKEYLWTQCSFPDGALMLSVADIPIGRIHFTGIIGIILYNGKEYRIATYLGAKAIRICDGEVVIRQRNMVLNAHLIQKKTQPLYAPVNGTLTRTIRESPSCVASYYLKINEKTIFSFETDRASFEYEYLM